MSTPTQDVQLPDAAAATPTTATPVVAKPSRPTRKAPAKPVGKLAEKPVAAVKVKPVAAVKATKASPVPAKVTAEPKAAPARKASPKHAAKPTLPAKSEAKAPKPAKVKLVRDSFTMPSDEYAVLGLLKQRALSSAHPAKKSELLRAGIKLLMGLSDAALLRALKNVPAIKTGRPKSKHLD